MICKSLKTVAMICLLAAFGSVSAGTASEEGVVDQSALSRADEVTTIDEFDEMTPGSSSNPTDQSSNGSSPRNMTVIDLSTLDDGAETEKDPNATVISYTIPSSNRSLGSEPVDVRALGNVLGPSPSSNVTTLSTLDGEPLTEESATEDLDNETKPGYESLSSATTDESEVTDVKALSEILGY